MGNRAMIAETQAVGYREIMEIKAAANYLGVSPAAAL